MKSVAQKIAITITLLLIIGFFVFSTANFFLAKWSIVNSVTHGKQESVKNAVNFVDAYFDSRITFVQAIAQELVEDGDFSHETISHRLKEAFRLTNIDALFVGYEADGLLIKTDVQSNNKPYILDASKKFDARTREWYKAAKRTMKSGISRPYPDITTGELTAPHTMNLGESSVNIYVIAVDASSDLYRIKIGYDSNIGRGITVAVFDTNAKVTVVSVLEDT